MSHLPRCPATGKIAHPTRPSALHHANELRRKGARDANVYHCIIDTDDGGCGGWHVTSRDHTSLARRVAQAFRR
jgi:hypothetical protein